MLKKLSITSLFIFVCITALSHAAFACACCAERGTHTLWNGAIDSHRLSIISEINFGSVAELYTTAAGFDDIRGLGLIETEYNSGEWGDFNLVDAFTKDAWHLTLKTPGGKSGTLVLPKPARFTIFNVDQRDDAADKQAMVVLYKEFRLKGTVRSGSGFFRGSIAKPAAYSLIFQGKGNNCDNASDFTHWRLEISGSKARYAFFGKLADKALL